MLRMVVPVVAAVVIAALLLVMVVASLLVRPVTPSTPEGGPLAGPLPAVGAVPRGEAWDRQSSRRGKRQGPSPVPSSEVGHPYLPWALRLAPRLGVPARALAAYAAAEQDLRRRSPDCRLSWATLAGIAYVESGHGNHRRSTLLDDGVARPAIRGPALDGGAGLRRTADTDNGTLDGDRTWDRAVGPLQFIPTTWETWASDGDGDGVANPHDIDDAALAAARYLCASGGDMTTGQGWWDAVYSYNHSEDYVRAVFAAAQAYATRSR